MKKIIFLFLILGFNFANANFLFDIKEGIKLYEQKDYIGSYNYFLNYSENNPNDEDGFYYEALSLAKLQSKDKARSSFQKSYEILSKKRNIERINLIDNSNIEDYVDLAAMYFEQKKYSQADDYSNMMIELNPEYPLPYFIKAKIAHENKDEDYARTMLGVAIYLDNSYLETNLAKTLKMDSVENAPKELLSKLSVYKYYTGDISGAIDDLNSYLKIEEDIDIYLLLCDCYIKLNDFEKAKETITYAKKLQENNPSLYLLEAKILEYEGEYEYTLPILEKAYKLNPNNSDLLLKLGDYNLRQKNFNDALKYYETLVNIDDTSYEGYFGYIYCLIEEEKTDSAIKALRKMTALGKNTGLGDFLLAKICENKANYSEALSYITQAQKKERTPIYTKERAKINYMLSNYQKSLNNLSKIPQDNDTKELSALNYLRLNDIENLCSTAEKLDKNSIMYKYYLYIICKSEGKDKEAQIKLAQIKKTKPKTLDEYCSLIDVYFLLNEAENAKKIANSALKKFEPKAWIYRTLVENYYIQKDYKNLKDTLKTIAQIFQ